MRRLFFMFVLLIFLLNASNVFAIGIYPSSSNIAYTPNLEISDKFTIHNNGNESMNIRVIRKGELTDYVSISDEDYMISPDERKEFYYTISLPPYLKPGRHFLRLGIVQIPDDVEGISVALGVETIIAINVPYPPKYLIAGITIYNTIPKETNDINVTVSSMGTEDVVSVGKLSVLDYFDEIVYSKDLSEKIYFSKTTTTLEDKIPIGNLMNGSYTAHVKFNYNNEEATDEKQFSIGRPTITITTIEKPFMKQGDIGKVIVKLQNNYRGNVSFSAIKLYIKNKVIEIPPMVLGALENSTMAFEIETKYFEYGKYKSILEIPYEGEMIEEDIELYIFPGNIIILIASVVAFLIIILIVLYIHLKDNKGRKK